MGIRRQYVTGRAVWRVSGLIALTLVGLLLRTVEIDRWPLWGDEALTLIVAQWPYQFLFFTAVDPTPGLYYSLHKLLLGPAVDAASARAISLVCGTLTIPAAYFLAREARVPALLTAALVALSFPLIDYSQEARAYSLLVLLVTLSAALFVRWSRSRRLLALYGTLAASLLAFYTHFASVFWIGPSVLAILWLGRRQAVAPLLLTAIIATPELFRLARFPSDGFIWLAQATPVEAADTLARMLLPFQPVAWGLLIAALLLGWRAWAHRSPIKAWAKANPGAALAICILAAIPLLAWLFGLVAPPVFMTRTILASVPGFILATALLLKFEQRVGRFIVISLYAVSLVITGTTRHKEDWRGIADRVGNDAVLLCEPGEVAAMSHVTNGRYRLFLHREDGLAEVGGRPWHRELFVLMSENRMMEALKRGEAVDRRLYPVWPVRAGRLVTPSTAPKTLEQAAALCDRQEASTRARYIAD